jgi:hypothetical protein
LSDRRDEQREWEGDAFYEAWRRGVPEGRLSYDRMSDAFENGQSPEGYVGGICRQIADAREAESLAAAQESYELELAEREYLEQSQAEQGKGGAS